MNAITIREVGPRDGLQSESPVGTAERVELITGLARTGLAHIEAVSFVSAKAVPSMAGASDVLAQLPSLPEVTLWALVPNTRGAELAVESGITSLTVTVSACHVYNEKNIRKSISESMGSIAEIVRIAEGRTVDAVLSCVFGSPYTGDEPTDAVPDLTSQMLDLGVSQVTLADTTGMATPTRIERVLHRTGVDVGLHLHDTRGTALVNAWSAMSLGVARFDTALGGLGGSPFAQGAGGNLPTEDLVHLCDDAGIETGVVLSALLELTPRLSHMVGRPLPGRIATHGPRSMPKASAT